MKKPLFFIAVLLVVFYACKKKTETKPASDATLFTYTSLKADKDTIKQGDVTNVRASISGQGSASWSASAGDVFGSGVTVLFGASTCCVGNHTINCTVKDNNDHSQTKSIVVFVHQ